MKILHLSEGGLPDWRIEKSAQSGKNKGNEIFFAGNTSTNYEGQVFSKIYEIKWTMPARMGLPYEWGQVKKQVKTILEKIRPDIIHAHNIFSAKIVSEFGYPFVFDDHEYWSALAKILMEIKWNKTNDKQFYHSIVGNSYHKIKDMIIKRRLLNLWPKWEKEIVKNVPTITVSKKIAENHEIHSEGRKIFVVPNFPMEHELSYVKKPLFNLHLSSIYSGSDGRNNVLYPHRNLKGLVNIFKKNNIGNLTILGWKEPSTLNVIFKGNLPRNLMYQEMISHSVGLLPWKKHWAHTFLNPNKPYEYAHSGLLVVCTSSFDSVIENFGHNCITFDDFNGLISKLKYFNDNPEESYKKRQKSHEFARKNLTWEKNEKFIFDAYRLC